LREKLARAIHYVESISARIERFGFTLHIDDTNPDRHVCSLLFHSFILTTFIRTWM